MTDQRRPSAALEAIRRWEEHGGTWSVLSDTDDALTVSLQTCSAGEEVDRITTTAADLRDYIGDRVRSDDD